MPRPPKTPIETRDWLTTSEVAEVFGVTGETVRAWINKGRIDASNEPGYWIILKSEVARFGREVYALNGEW